MARRIAEPLLWVALGSGLLWAIVAHGAISYDATYAGGGDRPVDPHLRYLAPAVGALLLVPSLVALVQLHRGAGRPWALAAGLALAVAGHGYSRVHDIPLDQQPWYQWVSPALGAALILLALLPGWSRDVRRVGDGPGPAGILVGSLLALAAAMGFVGFLGYDSWGWVGVFEEVEPAWEYGPPWLLLTVGLVAASVRGFQRRWAASGLAVVLAIAVLAGGNWAAAATY